MKRDTEKAQIAQLQRALHWVIRNHATTNSWFGLREFFLYVSDTDNNNGIRLATDDVTFEIVNGHVYWEYEPSVYGDFPVSRLAKSEQALKVIDAISRKDDVIPNLLRELVEQSLLKAEDFFRAVETAQLRQVYFDLLKQHAPYNCALLGTVVEAMWVTSNLGFRYGEGEKDVYNVLRLGLKIPEGMRLIARTEQQSIPAYLRETRFDNDGREFMHPADLALRDKHLRKAALDRNTLITLQRQLLTLSAISTHARRIAEAHLASIVISSLCV